MNKEQQRIAIAEACGWKPSSLGKCDMAGNPFSGWDTPPDYLNDLNAMHEAEKTLDCDQWRDYASWIGRNDYKELLHATAKQRAEAFLCATGKWVEE